MKVRWNGYTRISQNSSPATPPPLFPQAQRACCFSMDKIRKEGPRGAVSPPLSSHAFDLITMWYCIDWSNARRFESDSSIQKNVICLPARAGTAHNGLLQKKKKKKKNGGESLLNRPVCPPDDSIGQGTELN